jgi:peroxiredoxin
MGFALLAGRLLLIGTFGFAGVAKLMDLPGSRRAVAEFGVPARFVAPFGVALPLLELAVAVALVPVGSARFGALGAAVLLVAFIAAIANAMAHGRAPDCHCFGQVHSAPAGVSAIVRNALLLSVAGFVVIAGWQDAGASATHWMARMSGPWLVVLLAGVVIVGLIGFQTWFSLQLLGQNGRLLVRLGALEETLASVGAALGIAEDTAAGGRPVAAGLSGGGLPVGAPAPRFELSAADGGSASLADLLSDRRLVLVFSDAGCGPCEALMPTIGQWQREHARTLRFAVIASGDIESNRSKADAHGIEQLLLDADRRVADSYDIQGTPMAVVIGPGGEIESPAMAGQEAIAQLVERAAQPALPVVHVEQRNGHANGAPATRRAEPSRLDEPAPALTLTDLDGRTVELAELYDSPTLAIFWNPQCGFCERMLPDLKAFENDPPAGAPGLLVISSGDREATRAHQLRSRVLLDPNSSAAAAFNAHGTPMGVLIQDGRIISPVAAGAEAVFELARARPLTRSGSGR